MSERSRLDRFQWDENGDHLDEIVLSGVTFHIERMSHHGWWLGVHDPDTGQHLSIWWNATGEPVVEDDFKDVRREIRGPLLYHGKPWQRNGATHRCDSDTPRHRRCVCECGATQANPDRGA